MTLSTQLQELHETEGVLLHRVVVEHDIGWFFADLLSENLEFLVRVSVNIVGGTVKPEVVHAAKEGLGLERVEVFFLRRRKPAAPYLDLAFFSQPQTLFPFYPTHSSPAHSPLAYQTTKKPSNCFELKLGFRFLAVLCRLLSPTS